MNRLIQFFFFLLCVITINAQPTIIKDKLVRKEVSFADKQLRVLVKEAEKHIDTYGINRGVSPRSVLPDGSIWMVDAKDWTSGFFPGVLWYMYEATGDNYWKEKAIKFTNYLDSIKSYKGTHDLGFMMYCSFGNGLRLANVDNYKEILMEGANSLISRFNSKVGCIRSWDGGKWHYPVIIDNMMNLELLFWASKISGDPKYKEIAISHANTTMVNHFRDDYSSFHVVDYNDDNGKVMARMTHQGYSDSSEWARGQSWGVYGYTFCYRETKDRKYLNHAEKIANYIINNKNMPKDYIPYWDYKDPKIPNVSRDVSAAALLASALYELSTVSNDNGKRYKKIADKIVYNISKKYLSKNGENKGFITISSTGNLPANSEIDVPIIYGDYYYLEALIRRERLKKGECVIK